MKSPAKKPQNERISVFDRWLDRINKIVETLVGTISLLKTLFGGAAKIAIAFLKISNILVPLTLGVTLSSVFWGHDRFISVCFGWFS